MNRLTRFSFGGTNANGKLVLDSQEEFRALMSMMANGARVRITVQEDFEPVPYWLRKFYYGFVIGPTAEAYGYSKDEMHEVWKREFLSQLDPDHDDRLVLSTRHISDERMHRYIEDIRFAAGQDGCKVPEINEHLEEAA